MTTFAMGRERNITVAKNMVILFVDIEYRDVIIRQFILIHEFTLCKVTNAAVIIGH